MKFAKWLMVLFAAQIALAHAAEIDPGKSSMTVTFTQIGVAVDAKFTGVSGTIDFDAANLANSKAEIAVALASFDLGDAEYNREVQKKDWFDSAQFPQATFVSSAITVAPPGKLSVQGKLTIKGRALDVTVPVAFRKEGKTQIYQGRLPIRRLHFRIGEGEWQDTEMLADEVMITFRVVTKN